MIHYENLYNSNSKFFTEFREKFEQVINSGWFILGNEVKNFENEFASYHNVKNCIGVASGLDALTLSLFSM